MITVKDNGKISATSLCLMNLSLLQINVRTASWNLSHLKALVTTGTFVKTSKILSRKAFTSKEGCDIEGGLNVGKLTKLSGGVVVMADTDYGVTESEKEKSRK